MSGGEKKRKGTKSQGWEPAGAEFYQESYPGDGDLEVLWKDPKRLATLLPSKQTRAVAATIRLRTNDKGTVRRYATNRRDTSTVCRRASTVAAGDVQVSMLPDLSEMNSNEETAWEEIMKIKGLPIPMAKKREEKAKIMGEQHLLVKGFDKLNWKRKKIWHQFAASLTESYQKIELWRRDLKRIEGHFGTGVVAYFRFIKWLFYLNLLILLVVGLVLVLPTSLLEDRKFDCNTSDCFDQYFCNINQTNYLNLLQGTGMLEKTYLFYGYYPNKVFEYNFLNLRLYFNVSLAYIFVTISYFLIALLAIVRTGAKGFRERLIQGEGQFYQYSNLVFGGWDYCIQNEKSARNKHAAIYTELRTLIEMERREEERLSRSRQEKWRIFAKRFLVNTIVISILIVSGGAVFFIFKFSTEQLKSVDNKSQQLFYEFLPSLSIVALNIIVPISFQFLSTFEHYSPVKQIRMSLCRTVFLRMASLLVFYASMYSKIRCENNSTEDVCQRCPNRPMCWETFVGQQIYKLLLTDFAIQIGLTFFVNFIRALLAKNINNKFIKLIGEQTFDLPKHALDVVYIQSLVWVGMFFAPLIIVMSSVIFFVLFYVKKFACLVNCVPGNTVYGASKSTSLFMVVMLVSYPIALAPIALIMSEMQPSTSCGPFTGLTSMWSVVNEAFSTTPSFIKTFVSFLVTPGFAIPIFIVLILLLYYYTAVNSANRHMVTVLKNQLVLEGHDKKFLIDRLLMFIRQENDKRARMAQHMMMMDSDTITNASSLQS